MDNPSSGNRPTGSWRELLTPRYAPSLLLVCLGVWLHAADSLLVSTMMPSIVADIGGTRLISWTSALYEVGSIVAGAMSGLLSMRHGVRLPMAAHAAVYALGCALSAAAPEMWVMLAGRLLQGWGGGGLVALSFVSASRYFPAHLTARAMAAISTLWGVSAFLGPLIGGMFVEYGSWRGGFALFMLQAVALTAWILMRSADMPGKSAAAAREQGRIPVRRLACLAGGVVLIAFAGIEVTALRTPLLVLAGLGCLWVFVRIDGRAGAGRLLPAGPLNLRQPAGAALVMIFCFAAATITMNIFGPLLMARIHGTSALLAGYIIAASSVSWTVMAVLVSGAAERHDGRLILTGMALITVSVAGSAAALPAGPLWLITLLAVLKGGGFGMAWTFILRRARALAPEGELERVAGAFPTVQRMGYAVGAAWVGIVANAFGLDATMDLATAQRVAAAIFIACLPLAGVGLVAAAHFVRMPARAPSLRAA
ncbi:MFS transporter [Paroceanicella profunda]|uniref:MFS transporter n=1 Tax=Paroceanicella profunda TaxID=2579971 RepID=UPI001478134C|nr:MFS transporter [Paroceanicella profunda]